MAAAENSNKFSKTRFLEGKFSWGHDNTSANGTGHTSNNYVNIWCWGSTTHTQMNNETHTQLRSLITTERIHAQWWWWCRRFLNLLPLGRYLDTLFPTPPLPSPKINVCWQSSKPVRLLNHGNYGEGTRRWNKTWVFCNHAAYMFIYCTVLMVQVYVSL
jgi:hypothetical protein